MLSRRNVLLGAAATSAIGLSGVQAMALSIEPMAPADLSAMALACGGADGHSQLVADARLLLGDEIKRGVKPANVTQTIVCPLCQCALQVAPDSGF